MSGFKRPRRIDLESLAKPRPDKWCARQAMLKRSAPFESTNPDDVLGDQRWLIYETVAASRPHAHMRAAPG